MKNRRPKEGDFNPYYANYIDKIDGEDIVADLKIGLARTVRFLNEIAPEKWDHKYEEGKWSVKEILIHIMDTERIMSYRALRIARGDLTPMPGFEQDDYIPFSDAENRSASNLMDEYFAVRKSTIAFFINLNEKAWDRRGRASENNFTPLSLAYIIAGHELHHLEVIKDKYLD